MTPTIMEATRAKITTNTSHALERKLGGGTPNDGATVGVPVVGSSAAGIGNGASVGTGFGLGDRGAAVSGARVLGACVVMGDGVIMGARVVTGRVVVGARLGGTVGFMGTISGAHHEGPHASAIPSQQSPNSQQIESQ